jgi:hypothetical protein
MQTFTDNAGRTWTVLITVDGLKHVRQQLGIDLYKLIDHGCKPLGELIGDPVKLIDVLYVLCREAADKAGISDEAFGRAMFGDAIFAASRAFQEALIDFFPDPRVRKALRELMAKGKILQDKLLEHGEKTLSAIDMESEITKAIAKLEKEQAATSSDLSGSLPAPSASTPGPSPSAS